MGSFISILLYGRNPSLLHFRRLVLEASGYRVTERHTVDFDPSNSFPEPSLVVLCDTLPAPECVRMLVKARLRWPGVKALVLDLCGRDGSAAGHESCGAIDLLLAVAQLVGCEPTAFSHLF